MWHRSEDRRSAALKSRPADDSPGELEITPSTSDVAVCAPVIVTSFSNRAFSIAMTARAAKFLSNSICFSPKGRTSCRYTRIAPISVSSLSIGTPTIDRAPANFAASQETDQPLRRPYALAFSSLRDQAGYRALARLVLFGLQQPLAGTTCTKAKRLPVESKQRAELSVTDCDGLLEDGPKDRLKFA